VNTFFFSLQTIIKLKSTEQEITGDVLLELDVNLLKSEIGIMAFGKRMRIANAIADLRRPPSAEYLDHQSLPSQPRHSNPPSHSHSRTQSQSLSFSGIAMSPSTTAVGQVVNSYSMQNSPASPGPVYGNQQPGHLHESPVNMNDVMKAAGPVGLPNGTAAGVAAGMSAAAGVGLGIALSPSNAPSEVSSFTNHIYSHIFTSVSLRRDFHDCYYLLVI
jgi:hypothetical protein